VIKYYEARDICCLIRIIVEVLNDCFKYIDLDRIKCFRSRGSKSKAYARIHGLPRIWVKALNTRPHYIIEVLSENFYELSIEDKIYVIIHELLHIPYSFSGGLRSHGSIVNRVTAEKLYNLFIERGGLEILLREENCRGLVENS
jgi:predicted metallopeptidase